MKRRRQSFGHLLLWRTTDSSSVFGGGVVSIVRRTVRTRGELAHKSAARPRYHIPMELILEVTGAEVDKLAGSRRFTFGEEGGTIGRAASPVGSRSHWILPATMVSVMHAAVTCGGDGFSIEDRHS